MKKNLRDKQIDILRNKLQVIYGGVSLLKIKKDYDKKTIDRMEIALEGVTKALNELTN